MGASDTILVQVPLAAFPAQAMALILHEYAGGQFASYLQSQAAAAGSGSCARPKAASSNPKANRRCMETLLVVASPDAPSVIYVADA
jgi:hypothetical protein